MNSSRIQELVLEYLSDNNKHSVQEIKSYLNQIDPNYSEGMFSGSINTLLRNDYIKKVGRGVYIAKTRREDMRKCFVISPIGEDGSEIRKRADQLFKYVISPVCEKCDFNPIRVDQINASDSITQTILDHLNDDDLVIADMTGHNPNAFFEIGYRSALGKPMIHLKQVSEKIPFDVANIRAFDYDLSDLDSVEKTKSRLKQTINNITFDNSDSDAGTDYPNESDSTNNFLPILYEISDKLDDLKNQVKAVNAETIETIMSASSNLSFASRNESKEDMMARLLMEQIIKNPSSADSIMKLADKYGKKPR